VSGLPDYEPRIIEEAARRLYDKASAVLVGSIVVGGSFGAAIGAVPLTSLGEAWPIPSSFGLATLLVGAIAGCAMGYVIGDARAFGIRLQAQSTLYQLQLERNTAQTAKALALLAQAAAAGNRPAQPSAPPASVVPPPPAPAVSPGREPQLSPPLSPPVSSAG
jgi:hypothetical protein